MSAPPIGLAHLRRYATDLLNPGPMVQLESDILLALIDAVEAAREFRNAFTITNRRTLQLDVANTKHKCDRLDQALDRFTPE